MPALWRRLADRSDEREMLDAEELDPHDLRANLRELAKLNRLPGGAGASIAAIGHLVDGADEVNILDAGTGHGDMPLAFVRYARRHGVHWRVTALDNRPAVLEVARRRLRGEADVAPMAGDARALPCADASMDVAHASLLLHHLDPGEAEAVLRELRRVARRGVVINDLRRGPLSYLVIAASIFALTRNRYTRHDGPASARRAYTLDELDAMLAAAGLRVAWRSPPWLPRVATAAVRA